MHVDPRPPSRSDGVTLRQTLSIRPERSDGAGGEINQQSPTGSTGAEEPSIIFTHLLSGVERSGSFSASGPNVGRSAHCAHTKNKKQGERGKRAESRRPGILAWSRFKSAAKRPGSVSLPERLLSTFVHLPMTTVERTQPN